VVDGQNQIPPDIPPIYPPVMASMTEYMRLQGKSYTLSVQIPLTLRGQFNNRKNFSVSLRTGDKSVAKDRRAGGLLDIKGKFREAERKLNGGSKIVDTELQIAQDMHAIELWEQKGKPLDDPPVAFPWTASFVTPKGKRGKAFSDILGGKATSLEKQTEPWLDMKRKRPLKPRQRADYERAVHRFVAWCVKQGLPTTIESITARFAGNTSSTLSPRMYTGGASTRQLAAIHRSIQSICCASARPTQTLGNTCRCPSWKPRNEN
jgi:hypothetical protein